MYCIQCGVKLADTEQKCPLCGTIPFHPDMVRKEVPSLYPENRYPDVRISSWGALWIVSAVFLLALLTTLLCDLQISRQVTWSGYVIGALVTVYVIILLPFWFPKPNPIVLVPCDFAVIGLYLLYISLATKGGWFLSFALPMVGFAGIVVITVVTLTRYIRKGRLFIYGGAFLATGLFMPVMEYLMNITFSLERGFLWSFFSMGALVLLGGFLIFLGICRPARETMARKFFL